MAMGAFVSHRDIMGTLKEDPILGHITTFGGHPVCCAAALGNIQAIEEGNLVETCEEKGTLLESLLNHPAIVEVRRIGMMFAVEFESADLVYQIVEKCLERGVIAFYFLSCPESFRLAPPLTISEEEIRIAAIAINEAIEESVN
jgi:4-aminobutyrate aminotransferase-like enzyme